MRLLLSLALLLPSAALADDPKEPVTPTEKEFIALAHAQDPDHKAAAEKFDGKRLKLVGWVVISSSNFTSHSYWFKTSQTKAGLRFHFGNDDEAGKLAKKFIDVPPNTPTKATLYGVYDAKANELKKVTPKP